MKTSLVNTRCLLLSAVLLSASPLAILAEGDGIEPKLKLMSSGAMMKMGGYMPQRITLSAEKPAGIKKVPDGLIAPLYGEIKFGPAEAPGAYYIIVDEPEDKPARLFVDANANGDLTDDPAAEWKAVTNKVSPVAGNTSATKETITYNGGAKLKVNYGADTLELHLPMYRFDKNDPQRAMVASNLFYYADYAWTGDITLGEKTYAAMLVDPVATGDFRSTGDDKPKTMATMSVPVKLMIDVNGDGKFDGRRESFP